MERRTEYGTLAINDEVLAAIVQSAVLEMPGVADVGTFGLGEGLTELIKKDPGTRGVTFQDTDQGLVVEIAVIVDYGERIPILGRRIVNRISQVLSDAVSIRPAKVVVEVQGIRSGTPESSR
ncbi:MAG: hypothetical protein C7B47_01110 [Sulfobacillus thermosulfidooxidans]|uniref:Asp23/Gls24 family envelope stress response protein n=1 Tax=Sulfobacillus thermosulfidooxidans TaxID=28034 RepID=A0A2T2X625_SULTH|nr:MAG: hypothetical protein C7B47_01110 [Sulfobacillus thermosulfidooxidans]